MRREELERRLRALGWEPTDQMSGPRYRLWRHKERRAPLAVPESELLFDSTGGRLIAEAERKKE
jgi:hypothetical protein